MSDAVIPLWEPLGLDPNLLGTSHLLFAQVHTILVLNKKSSRTALLVTYTHIYIYIRDLDREQGLEGQLVTGTSHL